MNNFKIASAIALAMGLAVAGSASAAAASGGTITFTGQINDTTCTITGGPGTDGGQGNFTVALQPVDQSQLTTAGATAGKKAFTVQIGGPTDATCQNGKVATLSFLTSSPRIDATNGALMNALSGQATMADIQVLDAAGTAIDLRDPANGVMSPAIANNTALINFNAQYLATGTATPGLISTSVLYGVTYN